MGSVFPPIGKSFCLALFYCLTDDDDDDDDDDVVGRFYIVLFSALEQIHCAHVDCDSK